MTTSPPPRKGTMVGCCMPAVRAMLTTAMWSTPPTSEVPYLSALPLPALRRSFADLNGLPLPTARICGSSVARAIGTRSSYLNLPLLRRMVSRWVWVMSAMVCPSRGLSSMYCMAAAPLPPTRFTTTNSVLNTPGAWTIIMRAVMSVPPPTPAWVTTSMGREGNLSCARNEGIAQRAAAPPAKPSRRLRFESVISKILLGAQCKLKIMPASTALSHITVLDLTRVRAGPTAVRQLADWGAKVIKIEMPPGLDEGEGPGGPRDGSDFQNVHRNKRGMTLNLKTPEGVAILKKMAAKADVMVENYRPDVKDRLGIGY